MGPGEPLDQLKWERSGCVTFCGAIYDVYLKSSFKNLENVKFHSFQENGLKTIDLGIWGLNAAYRQGSADLEGKVLAGFWLGVYPG